jgi:methionyl-tRNA formyltransferase
MRILLLANNWVGWQVANWLKEQGEEIVGLVLHPPGKRKYGREIAESVGLPEGNVWDGSRLRDLDVLEEIQRLRPEVGLSVFFGYILRQEFIRLFPAGVINLHPAYLPYNRGSFPNVWSIIDGTPAGVTLHYIDAEIDTGDIVAQKQVPIEPVDTGESLYRKLERACVEVFVENWPRVSTGQAGRVPQSREEGTFHRLQEVEKMDEINLDRAYSARELINILRARTFPPYNGAYFRSEEGKIYLRLQLFYEDEVPRK